MPKYMPKKRSSKKPKTKKKKKGKGGSQKRGSCWKGYHRVPGTKQFAPGSCAKN